VRSLIHDLGQKLGCGAHVTTLRRLGSGGFDVANAIPLADALKLSNRDLEKQIVSFLTLANAQ
jgi:tRNA pseudouridine55 synthase